MPIIVFVGKLQIIAIFGLIGCLTQLVFSDTGLRKDSKLIN